MRNIFIGFVFLLWFLTTCDENGRLMIDDNAGYTICKYEVFQGGVKINVIKKEELIAACYSYNDSGVYYKCIENCIR